MARRKKYLERIRRDLEGPLPLDQYRAWSNEVRQLGVDWARCESESESESDGKGTPPPHNSQCA